MFRIYRYQSDGKLLEKVALPAPVVAAPPPAPMEVAPAPAAPLAKPAVAEYQPSWREVEVSYYEALKRERVNKEEKARKYLDLRTPKQMRLSSTVPSTYLNINNNNCCYFISSPRIHSST